MAGLVGLGEIGVWGEGLGREIGGLVGVWGEVLIGEIGLIEILWGEGLGRVLEGIGGGLLELGGVGEVGVVGGVLVVLAVLVAGDVLLGVLTVEAVGAGIMKPLIGEGEGVLWGVV